MRVQKRTFNSRKFTGKLFVSWLFAFISFHSFASITPVLTLLNDVTITGFEHISLSDAEPTTFNSIFVDESATFYSNEIQKSYVVVYKNSVKTKLLKGLNVDKNSLENTFTGFVAFGSSFIHDQDNRISNSVQNFVEQIADTKKEEAYKKIREAFTELKNRLPEPQKKAEFICNKGNSSSSPFCLKNGLFEAASVVVLHYDFVLLVALPQTAFAFLFQLKTKQHINSVKFYIQSSYSYFFSRPPPAKA